MRILIVRVGAMGDVLHALPAVAALRRAQPEDVIDWVVDDRWAPLLVNSAGIGPLVNVVHTVPTSAWKAAPFSRATLGSLAGFHKLRGRYELAVDMQGTLRSALIGRLAAGATLVGYADPRELLARWFYGRRLARKGTHVVEQGAALLGEACGVELAPEPAALAVETTTEQWAETEAVERRPLCMLAPGGGWGAKQWPAARFGELAPRLRALGFDVVVNAPHVDNAEVGNVIAHSQGAARAVVCSVAQMVALLRRTDLLIGNDSGPTHLAAALGVPLVALYGPTDPARNGPWGPGACRVLRHPQSSTSYKRGSEVEAGLARISVDDVLLAARDLFPSGPLEL